MSVQSEKRLLPPGLLAIGMVSFLMDTSSEMIHSLLPIFMTATLGLSTLAIGFVEGIGEGLAQVIRVFSGTISDNLGKRKPFMLLGYGIGALSKPLFSLATGGWVVLSARVLDRIGKGIRVPPRDALVADITPLHLRGAAYGMRQSLDTAGAFLGPILAILCMIIWQGDIRMVFAIAVIPAILCVILLFFTVREPEKAPEVTPKRSPIEWRQIGTLGPACWWVIALGSVVSLARFSEAFIILKASESGFSAAMVPLVLIVMNIVYSVSAYPLGKYSDTANHMQMVMIGMIVLIAANMVLANAKLVIGNLAGVILWGLHLGITQGLFAMMIANAAPVHLRATAFGVFGLIGGLMALLASIIAGFLWYQLGSSFPFYASMVFASIVIVMVFVYPRLKQV